MVDDDGAAGRQRDFASVSGFDLVFDLEAREQRHIVFIQLDAAHVAGHHMAHELHRLIVDFFGVDQHFADFGVEVIADGADHQAAFLVNQESAFLSVRCALNRLPQIQQVVEIPLQLFQIAADAGGAGDDAHACRHIELGHQVAQLVALFAFHPARHAAAARIVGHQHQIPSGEADEGGEGRAFIAALVLFHLDDDFLAFFHRLVDGGAADIDALFKVGAGDFFKREEAVTLGAIIDKSGFEAGLDAGDDTLVDIAFALLFGRGFDIEIDQFLAVNDGYAQLFSLRGVKQHAFHFGSPALNYTGRQTARRKRRAMAWSVKKATGYEKIHCHPKYAVCLEFEACVKTWVISGPVRGWFLSDCKRARSIVSSASPRR